MINLSKLLELTIAARESILKSLELEKIIKEEIAKEEAKKAGKIDTYKLIKKYIDKIIKKEPNRTAFHGIKITEDNKILFTNGLTGFKLNTVINNLPISENLPKLESIISDAYQSNNIKIKELPKLTTLKAQLKTAKAIVKGNKGKSITGIKEGIVKLNNSFVDVELLIECIEILGTENLEIYASEKEFNVIYLKSNSGEAVLMPLRLKEEIKAQLVS